MEDLNLRIEIDPNQLDQEWLNQPVQYLAWAQELANARLKVDQAKSYLDVVKAELDLDIRSEREQSKQKTTEAIVSNCVLEHTKTKEAAQELAEARHRQGLVQAAVDALDQRKRALENLVTLHGMSYFSEPNAKTEEAKEMAEEAKKKKIRTMWDSNKEKSKD